jgi:hypothetical protein
MLSNHGQYFVDQVEGCKDQKLMSTELPSILAECTAVTTLQNK